MDTNGSDLFDRTTISMCRDMEMRFVENANELDDEKMDPEERARLLQITRNIALFVFTGQRAEQKIKYLSDVQEREERLAYLLESAKPQSNISCSRCSDTLKFDFKTDWTDINDRERVLLFYVCPNKCLPNRAFFNNGEEYISKPTLCKKCGGDTDSESKRDGNITTITWICKICGYKEVDEHDFAPKPKEELKIDEMYEIDRKKYCLDENALETYRESINTMKELSGMMERSKLRKKDTKTNKRMESLKRLRVTGLQERITKPLEKIGMTKVELSQPTNNSGLKIKIAVLDSIQDRTDKESKKIVEKVLTRSLRTTNWRLIKSSLESTLGAITGELRGYTSDEEIRKIIERENNTNTKRTKR